MIRVRNVSRRQRAGCVLALCSLLMACSGAIDGGSNANGDGSPSGDGSGESTTRGPDGRPTGAGPNGGSDPSANPGAGNDPSKPGPTAGTDPSCSAQRAALAPMRRLTATQYRNTIADVFEGKLQASAQFPTATTGISLSGFSTDPESTAVTQLDAEQIMLAAEDSAVDVASKLPDLLPCAASKPDDACAQTFIDRYGLRALRRPPTSGEQSLLLDAFHAAEPDGFEVGIAALTQTLLQMPAFLYLVEIGSDDAPAPGAVVSLTDYELASRLSYLFWETMPDSELLAAAASGELATSDQLRAQAERLLADPRARGAITRFYREWSALRVFAGGEKDASAFPEFDAALADGLQTSFDDFVYDATLGDDATLDRLLTRDDIYADAKLASVFDLQRPSSSAAGAFLPVARANEQAAGLLAQPALLAGLAHESTTSPVFRGKFVRTKLLCGVLGSPPPDAQSRQPEYPPNATERDKAEALLAVPECAGCHSQMNPIGVAFEQFDAIGRYRTQYPDGRAIDDSGRIENAGSLTGDFSGVHELGQRLAQSDEVRECMTRQWLRFSYSRSDDDADSCALADMNAQFASADYSLRELLLSVTAQPEFSHRLLAAEVSP